MSESITHKNEYVFEEKPTLYPIVVMLKMITELNARATNQLSHPKIKTENSDVDEGSCPLEHT